MRVLNYSLITQSKATSPYAEIAETRV